VSIFDSPCTRPTEPLGLLLVEARPIGTRAPCRTVRAKRVAAARVIAEVSLGVEAFQTAEALRPDVIFVASSLSDMSGLEAVRALRDRYRRRAILVIAKRARTTGGTCRRCSGLSHAADQGRGLETSLLRARGALGAQVTRPAHVIFVLDGLASIRVGV